MRCTYISYQSKTRNFQLINLFKVKLLLTMIKIIFNAVGHPGTTGMLDSQFKLGVIAREHCRCAAPKISRCQRLVGHPKVAIADWA